MNDDEWITALWSETRVISVLQLFSSGIFCRSSPQFDDLFGFSVEDVLNEVKRGRKLVTVVDIFTYKSA